MEEDNNFVFMLFGFVFLVLLFLGIIVATNAFDKIDALSLKVQEQEKIVNQDKTSIEFLKGYLRAKESIICVTE